VITMKTLNYHDIRTLKGVFSVLGVVLMLIMLAGCAGGNYGKMVWDRELNNTFETYQVLPDHLYYVTGGYNAPAAILAIRKDFQLDNDAALWAPVPDVSPDHIKRWVDNLSRNFDFWKDVQFSASYILDPEGNRVGAWYSGKRTTTVKFLGDNRIKVFPPDMKPAFGGDGKKGGSMRR
jgi:hypothetical protein